LTRPTVIPAQAESRGGLTKLRHYKAVPFGIPAYAGMTVGAGSQSPWQTKILSILPIHVN